jgi:hypothetical protein
MDHCPREGRKVDVSARLARLRFDDPVLKIAFLTSTLAALGTLGMAVIGPKTLRPTMALLTLILLLMSLGALLSSRRIWLLISIVNNLALLLFFKYARFFIENLNAVLGWFHAALKLPDPSTLRRWAQRRLLSVWCWVRAGAPGEHFLRAPTIVAWDVSALCRILPIEARSP